MLIIISASKKLISKKLEVADNEVDRFGVGGYVMKLAKKSGKLKGQNLYKSQKLAKSGKNYQKVEIHLILIL